MMTLALPIVIATAILLITATIVLIGLYIWSRYALERKARHANQSDALLYRSPEGDYYDHKYNTREWIEIHHNRLIYTKDPARFRPGKRTVINLNTIWRAKVYYFAIFIQTRNGTVYRLPTGFKHQDEIYSAIKYHRTRTRRVSTR